MKNNRIKVLRTLANMTQKDLAEKLKIGRSTLSLYEIGKRDPDTDTLSLMASFFNVSTDYILCRDEETKPEEQTYLSSEEKATLKELGVEYIAIAKEAKDKKISPEDFRKLLDVIEGLNKK